MRILFFDADSAELGVQTKGRLFEEFTRRLVKLSGYVDVELRAKHASLEYDVSARQALSGRPLTGEAKAHDANIPGHEIAAFVGKLLPLGESAGDALFVSTSGFTAEAMDYLRTLKGSAQPGLPNLRTLVGSEIPEFLADQGKSITEDVLRSRIQQLYQMDMIDSWFVVSRRADFLLVTCAASAVTAATHAAFLDLTGGPFPLDGEHLNRLRRQVLDVGDLDIATASRSQGVLAPTSIAPVAAGTGWFDYKFPTPPECFIGREDALQELRALVEAVREEETAVRAVQVASRSGVGKSSLLLKLASELTNEIVLTVDGRVIRSPSDVRLLAMQVVGAANNKMESAVGPPRSQERVQDAFDELGAALRAANHLAIVQVDQFESVLTVPAVFQALLELVEACTSRRLPIAWILARKNDLTVTFDEGADVNLARLNELSRHIALDDFSPEESRRLLSVLEEELGARLSAELAESILTFSAGFPWLHKRLCAHALAMNRAGVSQRDLVQGGLRAEDLFEEDLAGLSEQDRALLRTLAAHLPNTALELTRRLESELSAHLLAQKLNDFLGRKLLRLSGDVYDTYNDVFKTYLVTQRIPFQSRWVFRVTPGATFQLLTSIREFGPMELTEFQERIGGNQIAILNKLRELRLLGLISPRPGRVELSIDARAAIESNRLGDFLRRALRGNAIVVRILDLLATRETLARSDVLAALRGELPHIEATRQTWELYSKNLIGWLSFAGMVHVEGERIRAREIPSDELVQRRPFYQGTFSSDTFLPTMRPRFVLELLLSLMEGPLSRDDVLKRYGDKSAAGLVRDAVALGLAVVRDGSIELGRQGRALALRGEEPTERDVAMLAIAKPNVAALLDAAATAPLHEAEQRAVLSRFGGADWAEGTWKWRLGTLRAWLVATGQAKSGRGGLIAI